MKKQSTTSINSLKMKCYGIYGNFENHNGLEQQDKEKWIFWSQVKQRSQYLVNFTGVFLAQCHTVKWWHPQHVTCQACANSSSFWVHQKELCLVIGCWCGGFGWLEYNYIVGIIALQKSEVEQLRWECWWVDEAARQIWRIKTIGFTKMAERIPTRSD